MNWRGAFALALSLLVGAPVMGWGIPAVAQTAPGDSPASAEGGSEAKVKDLKEHIQEASEEEGRLLERIEGASSRKSELDAKVGELDSEIADVQDELDAAQARLSALEAKQQAAEARLEQTRRELQAAKDELASQAIAAYTGQTEAARWAELLIKSRSLADLAARRTYLRATAGSQAEVIATADRLRSQVESVRDELAAARTQAQSQRDVVSGQRNRLQATRDTQESVRTEIVSQVTDLDQARGEILARKEEFQAQVAQLERDSAAIAEKLRQRQSTSSAAQPGAAAQPGTSAQPGRAPQPGAAPRSGGSAGQSAAPRRSGLVSPIPGARIVSGYGSRTHPVYGTVRMHTGVDLGASTGTPIRAAGDGVVVTASSMGGYGLTTVIDHGGGLATLYGHQSSIGVSEGQRVSQGQVIGRVGCTGTCTGPHLHYEVRINGSPVNPAPYL